MPDNPTPERYRAAYIPQVPMPAVTVEVDSLDKAVIALEAMVALSIFELDNNVKPDYSDVAIIERWDGEYWELVEDEEYEDRIDSLVIIGDTKDET